MEPYEHTVEIPFENVMQSLDAMLWVISPYMDDGNLGDYPWIHDLAQAYNNLVTLIPPRWKHNYPVLSLT